MRIDPELLALRGDPARQRHAQALLEGVVAEWRRSPAVATTLAELERFGGGAALADCPALAALFRQGVGGADLVDPLMRALTHALGQVPLGQVPLSYQHNAKASVLQLARDGGAALTLIVHSADGAGSDAPTICFADNERYELVLAGSADVRLHALAMGERGAARIATTTQRIGKGTTLAFPGFGQTKALAQVDGRIALLRLSRTPARPQPSREYRLSDGALVHCASGDRRESRHEMMAALLGRMRRADAAPVLAEMTRSGSDHLRWQALRECLALDAAAGFAALCAIAANPEDSLAAPAGALRAQLLEAHPQLAALENQPCLA